MVANEPWFIFSALKLGRKFTIVFEKDQASMGITASEGLMLKVASLFPGITVTDLGKKMGYSKSLVTKNIKNLVSKEFVETKAVDGRTLAIHITKKGWEVIDFSNINGKYFVDDLFADCTPEEREQFMALLSKLRLE